MRLPLACLLVVVAGTSARLAAGEAPPTRASLVLQAECVQLLAECQAGREAAKRDPTVVEHPPGVLFKTTSPGATRHVVRAIAIARSMQQKYGTLPACARACDDLLAIE